MKKNRSYRRQEQNRINTYVQTKQCSLLIGKGGEVKCYRGNELGRGFLQETPSVKTLSAFETEWWPGISNTEKEIPSARLSESGMLPEVFFYLWSRGYIQWKKEREKKLTTSVFLVSSRRIRISQNSTKENIHLKDKITSPSFSPVLSLARYYLCCSLHRL